jgi:hypothetical protein
MIHYKKTATHTEQGLGVAVNTFQQETAFDPHPATVFGPGPGGGRLSIVTKRNGKMTSARYESLTPEDCIALAGALLVAAGCACSVNIQINTKTEQSPQL